MKNNNEEGKGAKTEKSPPTPTTIMNNCHVYPDWASVQAFYGPRFAMPTYSNTPSSPATSHYMWAPPQSMIPHYGAPYTAFYAHYAHPGVPLVGTAPSVESPVKSAGNSDGGFLKKHKDFDGLAISIGNGSVDNNDILTERRSSDSEATDGSSHGSSRALEGASKDHKKRSQPGSPYREEAKALKEIVFSANELSQEYDKSVDVITHPDSPVNKPEIKFTSLDLKKVKLIPSDVVQPIPSETCLQHDREQKRERRKQSNRESARRSRLRKQAESEELSKKVEGLICENMKLKSEMNKMIERSTKLKFRNAVLMGKLQLKLGQSEDEVRLKCNPPLATVNLLERVNNDDGEVLESRYSPVKLHQLLDGK